MTNRWAVILLIGFFFGFSPVQAANISLDLMETTWELKPGLSTTVWTYNGTVPGLPIVVSEGERIFVDGVNHLPVTTNIHWHGLLVPNDQDGPSRTITPGAAFHYEFTATEAGTYWYHSHFRPVLTQVDMGLYAPFIVKTATDKQYSGDHVLTLDDWYLDAYGKRLPGTARGDMERYGNIETVNGKTGPAIEPLIFQSGELHKIRFINASTAAVHTLRITGHQFRVTHTDGHPLVEDYLTDTVTLSPGERLDVEVSATGEAGKNYAIQSDRSELGMLVPVRYREGQVPLVASPFLRATPRPFPEIESKNPDFVLELNSGMNMGGTNMGGMMGSGGMMSGHQGHGAPMPSTGGMMQWTINGKLFPDTDPLLVTVGQVVKVRFFNKDTMGMHRMDHPMHIHGAYFQVVSLNGQRPPREMWKDTINVPAGQYVDVAFAMKNPGDWMLHCHILDHEDGGMMTMVIAK